MILTREVKIQPNKTQKKQLGDILEQCRLLYNRALEDKIVHYKNTESSLSRYDLQKRYKGKENYPAIPASIKQMIFYRLELSFGRFFKKHSCFPRFKSKNRFRSFGLRSYDMDYKFRDNKVRIVKVGWMRMRGFRGSNVYKMGRVVRRPSGWYVQYQVEVDEKEKKELKKSVGLDVGLKEFLVDSENEKVRTPKFFRKSQRLLRIKQRQLSKKKRGGRNRDKARHQVARLHEKIKNQRKDFLHKLSKHYAEKYDAVCVEDLNVSGMVRNHHLALSISDAAWSMFMNMLDYKLRMLGGALIKVNPQYTSQKCSNCGAIVPKSLSVRTHICSECSFVADRDVNAALNILRLGKSQWGELGISSTQ